MFSLPSWLEALVLGLVQGLTEFLPVSSSGHLVVAPFLLGLEPPTLALGVMLHIATLVAVVAFFRAELWVLVLGVTGLGRLDDDEARTARRLVVLLAIGSVPAAVAGLLLESVVGEVFEDPRIVAGALLVTAGVLVFAERLRLRRATAAFGAERAEADAGLDDGRDLEEVGVLDAVAIGVGQALAIVPGVSRAGATMATGMVRGLTRPAAARFSFLLSIPIIAGAGALELLDYEPGAFGEYSVLDVGIGALAAGASGYWAISYLIGLVSTDDLRGFARYLVVLAVVVLGVSLAQ